MSAGRTLVETDRLEVKEGGVNIPRAIDALSTLLTLSFGFGGMKRTREPAMLGS